MGQSHDPLRTLSHHLQATLVKPLQYLVHTYSKHKNKQRKENTCIIHGSSLLTNKKRITHDKTSARERKLVNKPLMTVHMDSVMG